MKYSIFFAAAAVTSVSAFAFPAPQGGSSGSCDTASLQTCAEPLLTTVQDCGTDLDCLCSAVDSLVSCYNKHCPGEAPPEVANAVEACSGQGLGGGSTAPATSAIANTAGRATATSSSAGFGDDEPTSSDDFPSETSSEEEVEETTTRSLIDTESTATETESVTATRSADDEEETSSAEDEEASSTAGGDDAEETSAPATTTRRTSPTGSAPPRQSTQATGAAGDLAVPAMGGLLAMAVGAVAWL